MVKTISIINFKIKIDDPLPLTIPAFHPLGEDEESFLKVISTSDKKNYPRGKNSHRISSVR